MNFKFKLFWEDTLLGDFEFENSKKLVKSKLYNLDFFLHPFAINKDVSDIINFLESRRMHPLRPDRHTYFSDPSINGNFFLELEDTKGLDYDDCFWLKFDGDKSTWSDVNRRKDDAKGADV